MLGAERTFLGAQLVVGVDFTLEALEELATTVRCTASAVMRSGP
jgi:hypothetical protein